MNKNLYDICWWDISTLTCYFIIAITEVNILSENITTQLTEYNQRIEEIRHKYEKQAKIICTILKELTKKNIFVNVSECIQTLNLLDEILDHFEHQRISNEYFILRVGEILKIQQVALAHKASC
jgi:hypothetical protein